MKYVLINYNFTPTWVREYTDDFLIYDRSDSDEYLKDFPKEKIIKTENVGNVDYDKLTYLFENYDTLPDVFVLAKSNLFKYISQEEFDAVKDNTDFTPLLTKNHAVGLPLCFYDTEGIYNELNESAYIVLTNISTKYFSRYNDFARNYGLPTPQYVRFAPGGNYILTKERVQRYSRDFYDELRSLLPYCQLPGEAHFIERSYFQLWR